MYAVPGGSKDAGNGSIMRLAPVAVRFFEKSSEDACDGSDSERREGHQVCLDVAVS